MTVFSSLDAAAAQGFRWVEFRSDIGLHLVERTFNRSDGRKSKGLAYARPHESEQRLRRTRAE